MTSSDGITRIFLTEVYVSEINLHITDRYVEGVYDSCKNVVIPSMGKLALDLMCGAWGASRCSPVRWYDFMGDNTEDVVPFQINYILHNSTDEVNGFRPLDPKIVPCNESLDVSTDF